MASRFRRTSFVRLAVGTAALAIPLLAASSAVAAMGGALPLTSTFRPDLTTVTLVNSNTAQFCFDKTLSQSVTLARQNFMLGGYNSGENTSNTLVTRPTVVVYDLNNTSCVDATYPLRTPAPNNATIDYNQYTFGSVAHAAVQSLSGAQLNQADSTVLTGSNTNNGTTGNTAAPDLTGVTVDRTHNIVNYIFNKNLGAVTPGLGATGIGFYVVDPGGNVCRVNASDPAGSITFSGNTAQVVYPTVNSTRCPLPFIAGPSSVGNAVRAGVDNFVVDNATVGAETNFDFQVVTVPGTTGTTSRPDLVSASLTPDGSTINYNFDQPIGTADASRFFVDWSNGGFAGGQGGASTVITNTATTGTVAVTFTNGANFNEYDVKAEVDPAAAVGLNSGLDSTLGSAPVGDNAGAFARGFTTGPDAVGVTFASGPGNATVTFDQRIFSNITPIPAGFVLLDANGSTVVGGVGQSVNFVPAAAGAMQVTVHFSPTAFATAKALEICGPPDNTALAPAVAAPVECTAGSTGGSVFTFPGPGAPNVQQILSPFATSAVLTKARTHVHVRWHRATHLSRAQQKHRLARLERAKRRAFRR
jgi:hypothetical protein